MPKTKNKMLSIRKKHDMTQAEMAKLTGVTVASVGMWDLQKRNPSIEVCFRIIKVFNCHIEDLFEEE